MGIGEERVEAARKLTLHFLKLQLMVQKAWSQRNRWFGYDIDRSRRSFRIVNQAAGQVFIWLGHESLKRLLQLGVVKVERVSGI